MLKSYLTVALRQLTRQPLYSAINVVGLAIGLACFILIGLFVRHELAYDRHYANADRIYRISRDFYAREGVYEQYLATIGAAVAELLKLDFPQIEHVARLACCGASVKVADGDSPVSEDGFALADKDFFAIFDFEWLHGDPKTALAEPFTVVLTESVARKYFATADPLGRTIIVDNRWPFEVTGVIRDLPEETHFDFDIVGSLVTIDGAAGAADVSIVAPAITQGQSAWGRNNLFTYALLDEGADIRDVQAGSAAFFDRRFMEGSGAWTGFTAVPVTDIHLRSHRDGELEPPGSITTVYTFSAIALFILAIACINFMNLATARSAQRGKEVGVRKTAGAGRGRLVVQFIGESVVLAAIAAVLAAALVELALPFLTTFLGVDFAAGYRGDLWTPIAIGALALGVGFVAGSYPALYLAAFEPARVLRGDLTRGTAAAAVRKALVVLQFAISIALIVATTIVYQQNRFARDIELGYDKERVVVLSGSRTRGLGRQWETLKNELRKHPQIAAVTASNLTPGTENTGGPIGLRVEGQDVPTEQLAVMLVDFGFFETYGIDVVAGRSFSEDFGTDRWAPELGRAAFVVNELAARRLGWSAAEGIGRTLEFGTPQSPGRGEIVGVVKDVHLESVHNAMEPMAYIVPPLDDPFAGLREASIRVTGRDLAGTLDYIDAKWREIVPEQPLRRRFLDDDFQRLYEAEAREARVFTAFAALAIFIACLGLFGLASFMTERRTKEIGIRKTLGGGVLDIVRLLTGEFTTLVLIASAFAWAIAYFAMQRWLSQFAYRIDIGAAVFFGSGLLALAIAWLTVGGVAARAASAKPINALRYE